MREGKEKGVKENGSFMRAEEENLIEISEENRNKSWSSNTHKKKGMDFPDNMVNFQDGQNTTVNDHKINNITPKTDNTIIIYNETIKEVYIDKQKRIKPNSSRNHNTDEHDIHVAKLKQEIQRKDRHEEARKAEIMNGVEENEEINEELKVESSEKEKTASESQQDLQKVEIIEGKQQQVDKTTIQKRYHSISENIINKGMENRTTCNNITYNTSLNEQESLSQVKQQLFDKLIRENEQSILCLTEKKSKKVGNQTKKLESKDNITYSTENIERNNRKDSTAKNGIINSVQNVGEIIEDKVPVEMLNNKRMM